MHRDIMKNVDEPLLVIALPLKGNGKYLLEHKKNLLVQAFNGILK